MARPKKNHDQKRDRRFNLRYTASELSWIFREAEKAGISPHEYARLITLGHVVKAAPVKHSDSGLVSELNRIGVNLNQLARAVHMGRDFTDNWSDLSVELRRLLALMMAEGDGSETP